MEEKNITRFGMTPERALDVFPSSNESKLKIARVKKGLSQQGLADAAGVKKRLIQSYEQGERNINHGQLDTLCAFCLALDCKIGDILEDADLIEKYSRVK